MILSILQAAAVFVAGAAPQTAELQSLMAQIHPSGWIYEGALANGLVYKRGGPSAGMIWVRFEYAEPQTSESFGYKSDAQLRNYDCKSGSYVILQRTPYADNNLAGRSVALTVDVSQTFPSVGGVGVDLRNEVCSGAQ